MLRINMLVGIPVENVWQEADVELGSEEGSGSSGLHVTRDERCTCSLSCKGTGMLVQKYVEIKVGNNPC